MTSCCVSYVNAALSAHIMKIVLWGGSSFVDFYYYYFVDFLYYSDFVDFFIEIS